MRWGVQCELLILLGLVALCVASEARAQDPYHPIDPRMAATTITLTGHDMSIDQVVQVARYGARVVLSPEAKQRQSDAYGLVLEASTEGISIYGFNRGAGAGREVVQFKGDPLAPKNAAYLTKHQHATFEAGPRQGVGPEVMDEEVVRAVLAVRANTMTFEAASPRLSQMLLDLLNDRVTPVIQSRGSLGEADLAVMGNVLGTMAGVGDAYYKGVKMPAAKALQQAGLKPLAPLDAVYSSALISTNAYSVGQSALLVAEGKQALDWADLIYAMDLDALNSSVTPLSTPVQASRPFKWANLDAARVLDMIKGSYLFDDDRTRIIQDPESLRASFSRQGAAWKAWATLRDTVLLQINSSDHNPAPLVGVSPHDSWELSTPQMMKYYVKGGPESHGQHGYVFSNASWDPYPMANEIEAFTNAIANMDVAVTQRLYRFANTFFTVVAAKDVLSPVQRAEAPPISVGYDPTAIWQEIQDLDRPVPPEGNPISDTVEELQAETYLKVMHARRAVDDTIRLLGEDLLTATYWMSIRQLQEPVRAFGSAPSAVLQGFRKAVPWQADPETRPETPISDLGYDFIKANAAATFYPAAGHDIDGNRPDGRP